MSTLPIAIHSIAQIRAIERHAIEQLSIQGDTLMSRAAEASLTLLRAEFPKIKRLYVFCGFGNNAGDGYVLARLAKDAGFIVHVVAVGDPDLLKGEAQRAWMDFVARGGVLRPWHAQLLTDLDAEQDLIVDALLGIGLSRPVDGLVRECIEAMNGSAARVFALDVPTGLNADTGEVMGAAVQAHLTLTFIGLKQGFYLDQGPNCIGKLHCNDLQIPLTPAQQDDCVAKRIDEAVIKQALPKRARIAHKGNHGHVLMIGGGPGMPGAVRLSAEACLRAGAGLVTVATRPEHVNALITARPELMCHGVMSSADVLPLLDHADVIAIGPGLGQSEWAQQLFAAALRSDKRLIVDADALSLLALSPQRRDNWVLTPHPGEAARLLKRSNSDIQAARWQCAHELVTQYGGVVVLKGAATTVAKHGDVLAVCDQGNPGMAAPGMGDVLTGVVAGIAAQCGDLWLAARAGVLVHARAGDLAASAWGERGITALDVCAQLPRCVNP